MKKYDGSEYVPMTFHYFFVWFVNPLSLLALIFLFMAVVGRWLAAEPFFTVLNLAFIVVIFVLSFLTEIFLLDKRKAGVTLLYVTYGLYALSRLVTFFLDFSFGHFTSLLSSVVVALLIYTYYEKRALFFH